MSNETTHTQSLDNTFYVCRYHRTMPAKRGQGRKTKNAAVRPTESEPEGGMWDRLRPCPIRRPCRRDGVPKPHEVLAKFLVRDSQEQGLRVYFSPDAVKQRVLLPEIVQGAREVVALQPHSERTYLRVGLVRGADVPSAEFEASMKAGFNDMAGTLWVVPYLTTTEETEWLRDPEKFKKKMDQSWLDDTTRTFWVLDGATRRQLCVRFGHHAVAHVAYPDIAYDEASSVAIHRNEGSTHQVNATSNLDKALRVRQLTSDKMTHDNVVNLLEFWQVTKSRVSRFNQWIECFQDLPDYLEREIARPDPKRLWHEAVLLSPMYKRMSLQQRTAWMEEVEAAPKSAHFYPACKPKNSRNWVLLFYLRTQMYKAAVDTLKTKVLPKRGDLTIYKGDGPFEDLAFQLMTDPDINTWLSTHMTAKCSKYNEKSAVPDTPTLNSMVKHAITIGVEAWLATPGVKKEVDKVCSPTCHQPN